MSAGRSRVLIVDDEANLALGIAENLELEGYETAVAGDGVEALERLRAEPWDLVVLDVMMPRKDGLTVCAELRAEENDVPILFLTARGELDDRVSGLEAGGDDYLAKPFALKELLLRVAAILRRRSGFRERVEAQAMLSFGGNEVDFRTYKGRAWTGTSTT